MQCFVVAEAGVNHNGSENLALELIDAAARIGADAVKFQTFSAEGVVAPGTAKAAYQEANTGSGDQFSMLKTLELPRGAYARLYQRAATAGIEFMSTAFDEDSAAMLVKVGIKRIKVPSGEVTNLPFLEYLAGLDLPIILSTGMANLVEVGEAVAAIRARTRRQVTLLHCTSNYPADDGDVNLRAMLTLKQAYGLPVGYSDHTRGTLASVAAVAAGAAVIEKHFTLDRNLPGPDHRASLEPDEFRSMVAQIRSVETMLGSAEKKPCESELPVRDLVRRSLTLKRAVKANAAITQADIAVLRPGTGIPPKDLHKVIGRVARRDLPAWTVLQWNDFET